MDWIAWMNLLQCTLEGIPPGWWDRPGSCFNWSLNNTETALPPLRLWSVKATTPLDRCRMIWPWFGLSGSRAGCRSSEMYTWGWEWSYL